MRLGPLPLTIILVGPACEDEHDFEPTNCVAATQMVVSDVNPRAVTPGGIAAGIERCDEDTWSRVEPTTCTAIMTMRPCEMGDVPVDCSGDADCGDGRSTLPIFDR